MKPLPPMHVEASQNVISEPGIAGEPTIGQQASPLSKRAQMSEKQARTYAGFWFASFGGLTGYFFGIVLWFMRPSFESALAMPIMAFFGAGIAFVAGAQFGSKILLHKDDGKPSWCGSEVVLCANWLLGGGVGILWIIGSIYCQSWQSLAWAPVIVIFVSILSFVASGIVALPMGIVAAVLLARRRDRLMQIHGCAIHGYREGGEA